MALQNSNAKVYPVESIVIAMYGATVGRSAKLGVESTTNQACAVLYDFDSDVCNDFIWSYIQINKQRLIETTHSKF